MDIIFILMRNSRVRSHILTVMSMTVKNMHIITCQIFTTGMDTLQKHDVLCGIRATPRGHLS